MELSNPRLLLSIIGLTLSLSGIAHDLHADEPSGRKKSATAAKADAAATKPNAARLSEKQIEYALKFAQQHHSELASLLTNLRSKSSTEFRRGIRDVHLAAIRLERMQEKQPARFDGELKQWKIDSEIRLLSAKWIISGDKKLEKRIQVMLRRRQENRLTRLEIERDRVAARLEQLDEQINMDASGLEAVLDAEWKKLAKRATAARKSRRQSGTKKANSSDAAKAKNKE